MTQLSPRQVHLDFHTSELIPGVGAEFDPQDFARTFKEAHVSSVTVFARCHHGWMYYPSALFPQYVHPNLARPKLMVEQVKALHAEGIRAPVYITVQWDYQSANAHPEWLIRKPGGAHEGGPFTEPGFYQSLCVNTGYYDYLEAHTREVCGLLGPELDGIFFDIVGIRPCLCAVCRAKMRERGLDPADEVQVRAFAAGSIDAFKRRMTAVVRQYSADCTIFYNAGHVGPCTKAAAEAYTHFELESLPSGGWGYLHFPVTARYARKLGLDCMGMTGKFHTSWGDFHSLKNAAALEFECFRMLSYGFACSVGDQLEPGGRQNPAAYRLIGGVYGQVAAREAWARPSVPVVEAAVVTAEDPRLSRALPESLLGACQMLEELALQFDIVDTDMALDAYRLVILPDGCPVSPAFQAKLDAYAAAGGKILACADGGLCGGAYPACFGAKHLGKTPAYPDFIVAQGPLTAGLEQDNEYAVYEQGESLAPDSARVLLTARAPYFMREGNRFCSHRYTPSAKGEPYPAALQNGGVIVFSHPLFGQYRKNAPLWCKKLVGSALDLLLPRRLVRHDGPSTMSVSLLSQAGRGRVCAHVLSYIPVRKCAEIDIVEERTVLRDVTLRLDLPQEIKSARLVPENLPLPLSDGAVTLPRVDGYAIVELTV